MKTKQYQIQDLIKEKKFKLWSQATSCCPQKAKSFQAKSHARISWIQGLKKEEKNKNKTHTSPDGFSLIG